MAAREEEENRMRTSLSFFSSANGGDQDELRMVSSETAPLQGMEHRICGISTGFGKGDMDFLI
ncbi:hypothetical protein MA16_Dca018142 [Dendrobium catenatum]|uniref:Uncharacterized protein n=1 Tax=Dendrobium catenatum TaxID=906689 RepID=A0A2I0WHG2_9ASPA|nr:hypothetical protein MA16_Dca018142 [Dendrobium catenatum]